MLHPALATAPARSWFDIAAVVGAGALAGIALGLAARSVPAPEVAPAAPAPPAPAIVEALPQATLAPAPDPDAPADPGASPLLFVFRAGGATYVKLADIQDSDDHGDAMAMPPHAAPRLSRDRDGVVAAVAAVAADDVPDALRAWGDDRHVEVDEVCLATITGFAVVSRLVGDPGYAGVAKWTAAGVLGSGHAVLAARLDRCVGSFARDAALPGFTVPLHHHDAALETAARDALLASSVARDVQLAWNAEAASAGRWTDRAATTSEVLVHPRTGAAFVSVHALVEHGCGDPQANVWGLFRVQLDGSLAPVQLRALGDIETIDALLDVDGDGQLDILGRPWLGLDRVLARPDGTVVDQLALPLFGCPC